MSLYKVGQTTQGVRYLLVSTADGSTPVTGAAPTVTYCKSGDVAFSATAGTNRELGNGVYSYVPAAGEMGVTGPFTIAVTAAGAVPVTVTVMVVAFDPTDGVHLGMTALPNAAAAAAGGLLTFGNGGGQINPAGGVIPATVNGYAAGQDPATSVLEAAGAGHNTAGTIGAAINTAASDAATAVTDIGDVQTLVGGIPTAATNAAAVLSAVIGAAENNMTVAQALKILIAVLSGPATGLDGTTPVFNSPDGSKHRVSATVDSSGNRSVTTDLT